MKSKYIFSISLTIILTVMFFSSCNSEKISNQTTLHISPVLCEAMLNGITPTEFCNSKGEETYLKGKYVQAYVDNDGCLILTLKNETICEWKNTFIDLQVLQCVLGDNRVIGISIDYSRDFMDFMKDAHTCGYEISRDFTKVIETPEDSSWYFPFTTFACAEMQVFEGKTCREIKVEHIEINEKGEVIEIFIFPDGIDISENDKE